MIKPPLIRARIVKDTTVKGKERFRAVKPGEVVEFDAETFYIYKLLGLVEPNPLPPKKPKDEPDSKVTDSAGNPVTTR